MDEMSDVAPCVLLGAPLSHAHPVLDLGERLLDGVEVWRVGWQVPKLGAPGANGAADLDGFVAAQVVHDHDVPWTDGLKQLLVDPGPEALAVDRTIEDTRSDNPVATQGSHESHGAPVAMRGMAV